MSTVYIYFKVVNLAENRRNSLGLFVKESLESGAFSAVIQFEKIPGVIFHEPFHNNIIQYFCRRKRLMSTKYL